MEELRNLIFAVLGGVIGAFFKFWIEDFRNWLKRKLSTSEKYLLSYMAFNDGIARFIKNGAMPPKLDTAFKAVIEFTDEGEVSRLLSLSYIEAIPDRHYALTPLGWSIARKLKPWSPPPTA